MPDDDLPEVGATAEEGSAETLTVLAAADTVYVFAGRRRAAAQAVVLIAATLDVDWYFPAAAAWEAARLALPAHIHVADFRHLG